MTITIIRQELECKGFNEFTLWVANNPYASGFTDFSGASNSMAGGRYYYGGHIDSVAWRLISQGGVYLADHIIMTNSLMWVHGNDMYSYEGGARSDFDSLCAIIRPVWIWGT